LCGLYAGAAPTRPLLDPARTRKTAFTLKDDQIKRWGGRVAPQAAQQTMHLSAVMGLVIEEMIQRRRQRLLDVNRIDDGAVAEVAGKIGVGQRSDVIDDAPVFGAACSPQFRKILEQNLVKSRG